METKLESTLPSQVDDRVQEMLLLAERLRASTGGDLDDQAIVAVSEATGIPAEYVRVAVSRLPESQKQKRTLASQIRHSFLTLDPDMRRYVGSAAVAANVALLNVLAVRIGDQYGIFGTIAIILGMLGMYNLSLSRDGRVGLIAGALGGGTMFVARSLFSAVMVTGDRIPSFLLIPHVLVGGIAGLLLPTVINKLRRRVGLKDPQQERQELLKQLVDLQEKLRSGEQAMTFLSLDVAGSTRMKEMADPLSVEFTFTEYHKWVDWVARKYGGQVHSTAGDGVTCAFPGPGEAFAAARYMQTGIVELNTFRNKIGVPIQIRAGIHHGTVNSPAGQDITKINFAHVIDVAAHLQKVAPVGGIAVSESAAGLIPGGAAAVGTTAVEASNVKGYVWQPRQTHAGGASGPPPLPAT